MVAGDRVRALTPYLAVLDARRAMEWYVDAMGGVVRDEPIVMPDGRVGHAELGAALDRPPEDSPDGRTAVIRDPFGHRWLLVSAPRPEDAT